MRTALAEKFSTDSGTWTHTSLVARAADNLRREVNMMLLNQKAGDMLGKKTDCARSAQDAAWRRLWNLLLCRNLDGVACGDEY